MTDPCSDESLTSSTTSWLGSEQTSYDSFDSNLSNGSARKAKTAVENSQAMESEDLRQFQRMFSDALIQQGKSNRSSLEPTWKQQDPLALHRGLEAIASSLSLLTDTLGMALEEQLNHVETNATSLTYTEPQGTNINKRIVNVTTQEMPLDSPSTLQVSPEKRSEAIKDTQMKTSRDVAAAMATKAKLLLRELKRIKQDLTFTKDRCTQLEEENKRLRESIDKGVRHEEDDMVRLQLEALLTEKARLAQENATYARENQILHEVVQYHQLKLRNIDLPDDESLGFEDELGLDASALDMDFLPLYPPYEDDNIVPEEFLEMAS